jgi:hypothetical protein
VGGYSTGKGSKKAGQESLPGLEEEGDENYGAVSILYSGKFAFLLAQSAANILTEL